VALQPASRDNRLACYAQSDLGNLVRCALAAGAPANTRCGESDSPVLCIAASNSAARSLKALLTGGADVRLVDRHGCSALHWAAQKGLMACISLLLETGAPLEAKNRRAARNWPVNEAPSLTPGGRTPFLQNRAHAVRRGCV
jgi:ankyrin repeat protein